MPMTLIGFTALSVEMPTTVSTGRLRSRIARTMFSAPIDVGTHRLEREVLACRHLLERGRVEHHVRMRAAPRRPMEIAYVADAKLEQIGEVSVDDFVGRSPPVQVCNANLMLLCFVARQHCDLAGAAVRPSQQASQQHLARASRCHR